MATESLSHLRVPNIAVLEPEARLSPAPVPEIQSSAIFVGLNSDGAINANFAENNDGEWADVMDIELGDDCLRLSKPRQAGGRSRMEDPRATGRLERGRLSGAGDDAERQYIHFRGVLSERPR